LQLQTYTAELVLGARVENGSQYGRFRPILQLILRYVARGVLTREADLAKCAAMHPGDYCRAYLITPPALPDLDAFAGELEAALGVGHVAALQLRLKGASDSEIAEAVKRLMPVVHAHHAVLILNDRPDLAKRLGCDGVHVGQSDASYAEARRLLGPEATVGVTCHDSRHLAMEAAEAGADYVAFGAFYPTATKEAPTHADPEILSIWQETMETPCVAIGGINPRNAAALAAAGADFLAVSSGVWAYPAGPAEAVRALQAAIQTGLEQRSAFSRN
jgi:thiamine-phosphate pyrophosphorylase